MGHFSKIVGLALISMSLLTDAALADAFSVPEPSSVSLFTIGGVALLFVARMLKSKKSILKAV